MAHGADADRILGLAEAIRHDHPMAGYRDDVRDTGVVQSVYVQANWPVDRFEDEVAWRQSVDDGTGWRMRSWLIAT